MNAISLPPVPPQSCSPHGHLDRLAAKYGVTLQENLHLFERCEESDAISGAILPGWCLCDEEGRDLSGRSGIPLLPWRSERRFIELRNLVTTRTVETVCLWRSRCLSSPERWTLSQAIYREIGLCQWVLGEPFVSVYAATHTDIVANIIGRLASGIACGIEISLALPADSPLMDRHEAISRRGVASDQVVDSIVRPSSVYVMSEQGLQSYLDTDSELFGLGENQAALVREAFSSIRQPENSGADLATHQQICRVVAAVSRSVKSNKRIDLVP
ncbi:MAG: hypothetical protein WC661_21090 [Opitutaceae bacterium]